MIDLTAAYRTIYEQTLATLAEVEAGVHGEFGRQNRDVLAEQIQAMRDAFREADVKVFDA